MTVSKTSAELAADRVSEPLVKKGVPGLNRAPCFEDSLAEQAKLDEAAIAEAKRAEAKAADKAKGAK